MSVLLGYVALFISVWLDSFFFNVRSFRTIDLDTKWVSAIRVSQDICGEYCCAFESSFFKQE
jgi:hypothetical protein